MTVTSRAYIYMQTAVRKFVGELNRLGAPRLGARATAVEEATLCGPAAAGLAKWARWKLEGAVRRLGARATDCMRSDLPPFEDRLVAAELRGKGICLGAYPTRDQSPKRLADALRWNVLARRLGKRRNDAALRSTLRASRRRRRRGRATTPQQLAAVRD